MANEPDQTPGEDPKLASLEERLRAAQRAEEERTHPVGGFGVAGPGEKSGQRVISTLVGYPIGGGIVGTIVLSVLWGIIAGMSDPDGVGRSDIRDRDIGRMGARVEQAFVTIAGLGVIVLCGLGADVFWIANTMFFGFALSSIVGGIASVIAYRRGLV